MKRLAQGLIKFYQLAISPIIGGKAHCKYLPTCSDYSYIAIDRYGVVKGGWLTLKRILRCGPNGKGGYDPVPEPNNNQTQPNRSCCSCNNKTH